MPKTRLMSEADKLEEIQLTKDMLNTLLAVEKIMNREDISEREKKRLTNEIIDKKLNELKQKIVGKQINNGWDFSHEKAKDVFIEDEIILLRGYREEDNDFIRQIKKENSNNPDAYDDDKFWDMSSRWLTRKNSFLCSIINKKDNQFIGYISIKDTSRNLWEIAIELLAEHCNKGYGFRAVSTFLPAVSKLTGKKQFQALVEVDNFPSQRLMEKSGARLIDIYDYAFHGDEEKAAAFEESHLDRITDRMIVLANQIGVEPRKLLSHVLDYRFYVEDGKIAICEGDGAGVNEEETGKCCVQSTIFKRKQ